MEGLVYYTDDHANRIKTVTNSNTSEVVGQYKYDDQGFSAVVKQMPIKENTIYVLDRAYLCFKTLENIGENRAFFVTRTKSNTQFKTVKKNKAVGNGILRDDQIVFTGQKAKEYPHILRLVRFRDPESKKQLTFITNNLDLSARTIASIYKSRWDIELFFKWVKQNLKVKTFIGTTENAVRIQIWTAAIAYLLMEYLRFLSSTSFPLIDVFRIIGTNIFSDSTIDTILKFTSHRKKRKYTMPELQLDLAF
jgi:transposase